MINFMKYRLILRSKPALALFISIIVLISGLSLHFCPLPVLRSYCEGVNWLAFEWGFQDLYAKTVQAKTNMSDYCAEVGISDDLCGDVIDTLQDDLDEKPGSQISVIEKEIVENPVTIPDIVPVDVLVDTVTLDNGIWGKIKSVSSNIANLVKDTSKYLYNWAKFNTKAYLGSKFIEFVSSSKNFFNIYLMNVSKLSNIFNNKPKPNLLEDPLEIARHNVKYNNPNAALLAQFKMGIPDNVYPDLRVGFLQLIKDGGVKLVINIHGWNNDPNSLITNDDYNNRNYMYKFSQVMAESKYGDDKTIMTYNWLQGSTYRLLGSTFTLGQGLNRSVENAAPWIDPFASELTKSLKSQGYSPENIILNCHSLAAYLCDQIVVEFQKQFPGKKGLAITAFDPAATIDDRDYDTDLNTPGVQSQSTTNLKDTFINSTGYVGGNSSAGSKETCATANLCILVDFGKNNQFSNLGSKKAKDADLAEGSGEHTRVRLLGQAIYQYKVDGKPLEIPVFGINILDPENASAIENITSFLPKFEDNQNAIMPTKKYFINPTREVKIINNEENIPQAVVLPNPNDPLLDNEMCENKDDNQMVFDSNEGSFVKPYSMGGDDKVGCDVLNGDGDKDRMQAAPNGITVFNGEDDDDDMDLRYNLDDNKHIENSKRLVIINDFGNGEDKLWLNFEFKGKYTAVKVDNNSVKIVLEKTDTGEFVDVAVVKGDRAMGLLSNEYPPFEESSNLVL
jgi:hypothetical protein